MESPALSRSLGEYKLDVTRQRLWHRRVLVDIKRLEQWNVRMEQAQLRAYYLDVQERMQVSHSWYTDVSTDVAAFSVDGGALPVRSENETDSV